MSLSKMLKINRITLDVNATDWEDVIDKGCSSLLKDGSIQDTYVESIKTTAKEIGPYFVIAPGIAVPHSRPEAGVNQTSMSFIRLSEPVVFGHESNDPVKLVFTLATTDSLSHLEALKQLMTLLMNENDLNVLYESNDIEEILSVIQNNSKEE